MKKTTLIISCIFPFILSACGGGGQKEPPVVVQPPIVQPLLDNRTILGLQEPETKVVMAPSIIQIATYAMSQAPSKVYASQLYFDLDASLNLQDVEGKTAGSLQNLLDTSQSKFLVVVKVRDTATLQALESLSKTVDLKDITVIADDGELLKYTHSIAPFLRTGLDLRKETYLSDQPSHLLNIVQRTNQAMARFVILPTQLNQKSTISSIQRLLVSVWVETGSQPQDVASALVSGANGVLTKDSQTVAKILQQFPTNTLLRKPLVIGHRGVPSLEDENTLESAKRAVSLGADIVENDIFITKDNHLVIMHDDTVDRTTNGKGNIEDMTLAQVKQFTTKTKGYKVPTLEEFFQEFKSNKNMVHFIELKSKNPLIVPQLKEEIAKYAVDDQVVTISFYADQIRRVKDTLPGTSTGFLTGTPNSTDKKENLKKILEITQSLLVTFNPGYADNLIELMEASKHRSLSVWPWTINDEAVFKRLYTSGTYGITTNYAQYASKYVVDIQANPNLILNQENNLSLNVQLKTQDGTTSTKLADQFIVLAGSPAYEIRNGQIRFIEKGTAYILAGYKYQIDAQNFYQIFSAPVKVVVN